MQFRYPFHVVLDCAIAYLDHGLLPGAGGVLDQDAALWEDVKLCIALLSDAQDRNRETGERPSGRRDWLADMINADNPVAAGGAVLGNLWGA